MRGMNTVLLLALVVVFGVGCGNSSDKKAQLRKREKNLTTGQQFVLSTGLNKIAIDDTLSGEGDFVCSVHDERQLSKVKEEQKSDPNATLKVHRRFLEKNKSAVNIYGIVEGNGARIELFSEEDSSGKRQDYYVSIIQINANGDNLTQEHKRSLIGEELVLNSSKYKVSINCKYSPKDLVQATDVVKPVEAAK